MSLSRRYAEASGLLAVIALLATPGTSVAQGVPLGPEFRVNSYVTGRQYRSAVASDAAGNFVVVWESFTQDGDSFGIFAQRYAAGGTPLGGEFRVNTYTTGTQHEPAVASDAAGNFVVVWGSLNQGETGWDVLAQRYASSGAPLGGEFRVNTLTSGSQSYPSVASEPAGNFVVTWQGPKDGDSLGVFGQRYASSGAPLGGEFKVNTFTTGLQYLSAVAADFAGNFVVSWVDWVQDGSGSGVFAQRYASTGSPLGPEFRVNTYTTETDTRPSVACDAAGNFVVVWYSRHDGSSFGIDGQRFASTGTAVGGEFRVNTYTTSAEWFPVVASDTAGDFVVVWESYGDQDGHYEGIYAQRYANTGAPLGVEFRVNTHTTNSQMRPSVAADANGHFVVVWQSFNQNVPDWDIYAQRYSMIVPVELQSFRVE